LQQAEVQAETAAAAIVRAGAASANGSNPDVVDLSAGRWLRSSRRKLHSRDVTA
jgi:hypothetical protein